MYTANNFFQEQHFLEKDGIFAEHLSIEKITEIRLEDPEDPGSNPSQLFFLQRLDEYLLSYF